MRLVGHLFKQLWKEQRRVQRAVSLALVAAPALLATAWGQSLLESWGFEAIQPAWLVAMAVCIALGVLAWSFGVLSYNQARELEPKVSLDFAPDAGGIVITPVKYTDPHGATREGKGVYIRLRVSSLSRRTAKECSGYLVSIEKIGADGLARGTHFFDPLLLEWSHRGAKPINLPRQVPQHLDLLKAYASDSQLTFAGGWPLTMRAFFSEKSTYRLKVIVEADGIDHSIQIDVRWNGKWDEVSGQKVST